MHLTFSKDLRTHCLSRSFWMLKAILWRAPFVTFCRGKNYVSPHKSATFVFTADLFLSEYILNFTLLQKKFRKQLQRQVAAVTWHTMCESYHQMLRRLCCTIQRQRIIFDSAPLYQHRAAIL